MRKLVRLAWAVFAVLLVGAGWFFAGPPHGTVMIACCVYAHLWCIMAVVEAYRTGLRI